MKRLIMCEGSNELAVVNILLENDALIFTEDDLLGLTPYHARQIKNNTQVQAALSSTSETMCWSCASATSRLTGL